MRLFIDCFIPMDSSDLSKRLIWVDWMKVIGIYLIVVGHFFPPGETFIYVFSVPVFFLISGILCKKERTVRSFWSKLWHNLMLPCYLFCTLNVIAYIGFTFIDHRYGLDRVLTYSKSIVCGETGGV